GLAHLHRGVEELDVHLVVARDHAGGELDLGRKPHPLELARDRRLALAMIALGGAVGLLQERLRRNVPDPRRAARQGHHEDQEDDARRRRGPSRHGGWRGASGVPRATVDTAGTCPSRAETAATPYGSS